MFRIVHEASLYDQNSFITLTYRDKADCTKHQLENGLHVPDDGSLVKSHFQKFMKRLRKKFEGRVIRYYQCGEYGEQLHRPHYHACLFNLEFPDEQLFKNNDGNPLFTSQILEDLWGYGFCTVGQLTAESAAYCARYVTKKVSGANSHDHYLRCDEYGEAYWLLPEYAEMSRRPGIGKQWYENFKADVYPSDEIPVPGSGVYKSVPRYYDELHKAEYPEQHAELQRIRQTFMAAHKEEYSPQRLMDKYKVKKAQIQTLSRSLEIGNAN